MAASASSLNLSERAFSSNVAGAINTAVATSVEVDYRGYSTGTVYLPATTGVTGLTFYASTTAGGTYHKVYTAAAGAALAVVVVPNALGNAVALPSEIAACSFIKLVAAGVADADCVFDLQA
tara:strand:+ start:8764 stop:9129 length:366 start_codon:yes stop_codon:yes gene_type:complete